MEAKPLLALFTETCRYAIHTEIIIALLAVSSNVITLIAAYFLAFIAVMEFNRTTIAVAIVTYFAKQYICGTFINTLLASNGIARCALELVISGIVFTASAAENQVGSEVLL